MNVKKGSRLPPRIGKIIPKEELDFNKMIVENKLDKLMNWLENEENITTEKQIKDILDDLEKRNQTLKSENDSIHIKNIFKACIKRLKALENSEKTQRLAARIADRHYGISNVELGLPAPEIVTAHKMHAGTNRPLKDEAALAPSPEMEHETSFETSPKADIRNLDDFIQRANSNPSDSQFELLRGTGNSEKGTLTIRSPNQEGTDSEEVRTIGTMEMTKDTIKVKLAPEIDGNDLKATLVALNKASDPPLLVRGSDEGRIRKICDAAADAKPPISIKIQNAELASQIRQDYRDKGIFQKEQRARI